MTIFLFTLFASIAALAGGLAAIKSKKYLKLALAFTAGLVLGLVAFDLLPEIFDISNNQNLDTVWPMLAFVAGFITFHMFEKFVPLHESSEEEYGPHRHPSLGVARALALSGHSFLDGLSIGVAFQVSSSVGAAVALAVIGHRFADGFDTTIFMVFHKNKLIHIKRWLAVVVAMPVIGGLVSLVYSFSESVLAIYLGFFAGLILYIAASNLLPQAHSKKYGPKLSIITMLGALSMLLLTRLI